MKRHFGFLPVVALASVVFSAFVACSESESSTDASGADTPAAVNPAGGEQPGGAGGEGGTDSGADAAAAAAAEAAAIAEKQAQVAFSTGFQPCQFNFGSAWTAEDDDKYFSQGAVSNRLRGMDYISVWLGDNEFYNSFEERMVETSYNIGATPMIYAYVIAEYGKDQGLVDCDVSAAATQASHCTDGANIIRNHFDDILARYTAYAKGMKEQLDFAYKNNELKVTPEEFVSIWLIEPDFYQYSESGSNQKYAYDSVAQVGGGIPMPRWRNISRLSWKRFMPTCLPQKLLLTFLPGWKIWKAGTPILIGTSLIT